MSCDRVERWLDEGRPAADEAACRAHAASCARCAAALRAALAIDELLARAPAPAPESLTEHVMARVTAARQGAWRIEPPAFDWWVRAAAEPSVALALILAALLAWGGNALPALAAQGLARLATALAGLAPHGSDLGPFAQGALWLMAALALPWISWRLYRWLEARVPAPAAAGASPRVAPRVS
ncbi:MAG TPA: hypothetical protein VI792_00915 [Candidatus Eisenbacteria bacterium]